MTAFLFGRRPPKARSGGHHVTTRSDALYIIQSNRTNRSRSDDEPPTKRPPLSRMALDLLTIQPMSTECERLFSAAGKMVSGLRTNLDAEIIAICQVLRSWYRAGLIKDLDPLLMSHLESKLDAGCGTLSDDDWLLLSQNGYSRARTAPARLTIHHSSKRLKS